MKTKAEIDEILPEYDFSKGVRGKHFKAYQENTNVVFMEEDIAKIFKTSESVNHALRLLINIADQEIRKCVM